MRIIRKLSIGILVLGSLFLVACNKSSETKPASSTEAKPGEQTVCPVSGDKIDTAVFVEHEGKKVYFCCSDCIKAFKADPAKFTVKLPQFGGKETPGHGEGS